MISFCVRNSLLTFVASAVLALAGVWAWRGLPVDAIPDLSDNQVIVWAEWPGKSAQDVDEQITSRLSRELQGLPGVATVRGMSLFGAGYVYVIFDESGDLYESRTRVLERLSQTSGLLPTGVQPRLGPDATAMGQVYAFALSGPRDVESKRHLLDQVLLPALRAVPGVAEVSPAGGVVREYQVDVDPLRLQAMGLSLDDLMQVLQKAGRDVGAMSVERSGIETMVRGVGFLRDARQIEDLVVRGDRMKGAGLRLGDIARVQVGGQFRQGLLADDRGEQVGAIVAMRVGHDPKTVIEAVKKRIGELSPALTAEQLRAEAFYDRSTLIEETTATLASTLEEAIITTVIVIVVFLLHVRGSFAVAISLPLGMLFTFLVMRLAGVSANIMSLAGIAIAVGVMVDFGIIMTENATQHLVDLRLRCEREGRAMPVSPNDPEIIATVIAAAKEVARPLATSAATTVIGFLPIFALTDQAGRLFEPLALTKSLAIGSAVIFGTLLVPTLCRYLLPPWQLRRPVLAVLSTGAAAAVFIWLIQDGWTLPLDQGRAALHLPGWLVAPVVALAAFAGVWRIGREKLVDYEQNPTSRLIHVAYDWAYNHIQRHRLAFTALLLTLAGGGYLLGLGWPILSAPLRSTLGAMGVRLDALQADHALSRWFPGVDSSFLPPLDEGSLLFMPSLPATAGLGETQRVMDIQNRMIRSIPEVAGLMGKMGRAETALDPAPIGMIETVVVLKPYRDWPLQEMSQPDGTTVKRARTLSEVRDALAAATDLPGVAPSWLQPIETRVVMLSTGIRSLIALQVLGDDSEALEEFAMAAEKVIQRVPGAADVQMQREGGKPYAEVRLDPVKLARFGLSNEAVMSAIEAGIGGMPVTYTVEGTQRYPVRLRYLRELRDDADELTQLKVGMGQMAEIPLSSLLAAPTVYRLRLPAEGPAAAEWLSRLELKHQRNWVALEPRIAELTIPAGEALPSILAEQGVTVEATRPSELGLTYTVGPMAIRSEGGKRTQYVLLNAKGRGEVEVVRAAEEQLREAFARGELKLPSGATYRWVGRYEQKLKADATLRWVISASMLVMVVLIYIGTRSWLITAIIVLCNASVTTAGGFFLVWMWDAQLTTAVMVGFLVLLGVMFNDGILLGTYLQEQFRVPPTTVEEVHQRVFTAGLRRRRPAIMTNATTLLSLVPVLWASGRGAEVMTPMVLPVVGGMIFDVASLFSVPVFFAWYWERKLARAARAAKTTDL